MSYGLVRRLSEAARSSVVAPKVRHSRPLRLADLEPGWAVVDLTGRHIGRLDGFTDAVLVVALRYGLGRIEVPSDRVAELRDGQVRLAMTSTELAASRATRR